MREVQVSYPLRIFQRDQSYHFIHSLAFRQGYLSHCTNFQITLFFDIFCSRAETSWDQKWKLLEHRQRRYEVEQNVIIIYSFFFSASLLLNLDKKFISNQQCFYKMNKNQQSKTFPLLNYHQIFQPIIIYFLSLKKTPEFIQSKMGNCTNTKTMSTKDKDRSSSHIEDKDEIPISKFQLTNPLVEQPYKQYQKQYFPTSLQQGKRTSNPGSNISQVGIKPAPLRLVNSPQAQYRKYIESITKQNQMSQGKKNEKIEQISVEKSLIKASSIISLHDDNVTKSTNSNENSSKKYDIQHLMIQQSNIHVEVPGDGQSALKKATSLPVYLQSKIKIDV